MRYLLSGVVMGFALVSVGCGQSTYESTAHVKVEAKMKTTDLVFNVEGLT